MTASAQRASFAGLLAACCVVVTLIASAFAQAPGDTVILENARYGFTVALPAGCRHEEGPGTIDAICGPEVEQQEGRSTSSKLSALFLQVSAETVGGDTGKAPSELAQQYPEATFKAELPEAVCGESDSTRAKVQNVKATLEDARLVYTANVVCSGVRFLQVPERTAAVRYIIAPAERYRLIARATSEDFEKQKAKIEAFLASFAVSPATK